MCWAQPAVMVDANGKPIYGEVSDKEILAHLDRHSKAVMKDFYRTSEFCAACHKAALPREDESLQVAARVLTVYDEWQQSSFGKESPLPFYVKDKVSTCQTCHMEAEPIQLPRLRVGAGQAGIASLARREYGAVEVLRLRRADGEDHRLSAQQCAQCGHLWASSATAAR